MRNTKFEIFSQNEWRPLAAATDGGRMAVLGFLASEFGQMDCRSACLGVFGEEFLKKFLILMEGGGRMRHFSIFPASWRCGGRLAVYRWRKDVGWSELVGG